jgi:foldase protein PrsA
MGNGVRAAAAGLLVLLLLAGCDREPAEPGERVIAYLDDEPIHLSELEEYFETNLLELGDEEPDSKEIDQVKSRLLDSFVEERMLLAEAERRGIEIEAWEISAFLGLDGEDGDEEERAAVDSGKVKEARGRLMVQKLRELAVRDLPPPNEAEIREYAERHRDRLLPERALELRALMFESQDEANRVYGEIRRKRITFNEAVVAYESYPGQGRPQRMAWESLSDEVKSALEDLRPGRVSPPLELGGSFYLFRVESWFNDPEQLEAELLRKARRELEAVRRNEASATLLRELRATTRVRLRTRNLPFRYVK